MLDTFTFINLKEGGDPSWNKHKLDTNLTPLLIKFLQVLAALARKLPHAPSTFLAPGEKVLDWGAGSPDDLKPWRPNDPKFW